MSADRVIEFIEQEMEYTLEPWQKRLLERLYPHLSGDRDEKVYYDRRGSYLLVHPDGSTEDHRAPGLVSRLWKRIHG